MIEVPYVGQMKLWEAQLYAGAILVVLILLTYSWMGYNVYRIFFTREFDYDPDVLEKEIRGGNPASSDALTRQFGSPEKRLRLKQLRAMEQERAVLRAAGDEITEEMKE